jgi:PAS domain S-box-containing protein/putative nucleotidyltransferase with HDIG domain
LRGLRKGHTADATQELRLIDKAGAYLSLECVASVISRENQPHAVMLIARDITQARKLEQQLQKSEQKFLILAEESREMIFIATEGRLAYVNKASESMLGYSVEELTSPDFNLIRIASPEYKRTLKKIFSSLGHDTDYPAQEIEFIHRNGGRVSAIMNIKLTHYDGENAIFGVINDVSAIKTAEKAQFESAAKLVKAITAIIDAIASTMELKDPYTFGHQMRVTEIAVALARELQLSANDIEGIRLGSMVHDIGKTYIPTQILSKPPPLNRLEFDLIKMHPRAGYDILKKIDFPWPIPEIALQHHERLDGSGYPAGLVGDDILFEARVVAVADVIEAMSSHRPYRPSMGIDKALVEIVLNKDKLYDARVVDACQTLFYDKGYVIPGA